MLKTILTAAAIALPAMAQADNCEELGGLAETIMEHRQGGTPMSTLMPLVSENEFFVAMVLDAYDAPRMSVPENQRREVEDFRNAVEALCYGAAQ